MKYFAKYLSVEGEIEEGDYWTHSGLQARKIIDIDKKVNLKEYPEVKTKRDYLKLKNAKLCKLFLCSRDIQIGDWITNINRQETHVDEELLSTINKGLLPEDFKVIGEISPEAIWVKEGDEFDEDDVRFMIAGYTVFSGDDIERNSCSETEWIKTKLEKFGTISKYIEIKCPTCKMFH